MRSFEPTKCQCCLHIETSRLICTANIDLQLISIGFYMRATMALNGLTYVTFSVIFSERFNILLTYSRRYHTFLTCLYLILWDSFPYIFFQTLFSINVFPIITLSKFNRRSPPPIPSLLIVVKEIFQTALLTPPLKMNT